MEDLQYRKTEGILYSHFRRIKRINRIKYDIDNNEKAIERIQYDLKSVNVELDQSVQAIDYSTERVQSSSTTISAIEKELIRITDKLLNELKYKIQKKYKLRERLRRLEEEAQRVETIFKELTDEELQIVELKYGEGRTIRQMEMILPYARTSIHRKKDEIINFIASQL